MIRDLSVHVTRGDLLESSHRIQAIFLDQNQKTIFNQDSHRKVFPRSAIKVLQAIPFLQSNALHQFYLGAQEVCLACASHNGESIHIKVAQSWLKKIKKKDEVLLCGHHRPMGDDSSSVIAKLIKKRSPLLNNCSGKHLGMISRCLVDGLNIQNYLEFDHNHQLQILSVMEEFFEEKIKHLTRDGCHAPMFAISLKSLALAALKISNHHSLMPQYAKSITLALDSIQQYPFLTAGHNQFDSNLIKVTKGRLYFKRGAEGIGFIVDRQKKIGGAIKIEDGNMRALPLATLAILKQLKLIKNKELNLLQKWMRVPILNCNQFEVGAIIVPQH